MKAIVSIAVLTCLAMTACTRGVADNPPAHRQVADDDRVPRFDHVVMIMMENRDYDEVIDSSEAPFLNALADRYANARAMYGVTHPSLPNYLALISGDTHGVAANCGVDECSVSAPNLVTQLESAGIPWKAYMQSMPTDCATEDREHYVVRHNPFVYFEDIRNDDEVCSNVVPLDELSADLASGSPARFVWVTPNLCNDAHDCDISVGDAFLAEIVPTFLEDFGPNDLLVITYDEGQTDDGCCGVPGGGHIPTVLAGPAAREGAESSEPYTLYSILRAVEDGFGLPLLGHAGDAQTKPMADLIAGRPD